MHLTRRMAGRRGARGFTLIELLVTMTLGLGVAATVAWFQRSQFLAMEEQAQQIDLQTTARAIVDVFARDVRRAGMNPSCSADFTPLAYAARDRVRIQADLNANGVLDAATEELRYRVLPTDRRVERQAGSANEILLENVTLSGSRLRYYDGAGTELIPWFGELTSGQRATVRRIRLELVAQGSARSGRRSQPLVARAATDVELRNRFFINTTGCP